MTRHRGFILSMAAGSTCFGWRSPSRHCPKQGISPVVSDRSLFICREVMAVQVVPAHESADHDFPL